MEKSHKSCMEQAEIIDTFGTYQHPRPMVREGTLYIPTPPEVSDPSSS